MLENNSIPILALRRSFGELQHAVLGLARSAGRLGIPVYAVTDSAYEIATQSRHIRGTLRASRGWSDGEWLDALLEFGLAHGRPVLLAIDDDSAAFADEHHSALRAAFRMAKDPEGMHRRLASKRELWQVCRHLGLPTPRSSFPSLEEEAASMADEYGYPVVLKRSEQWRPTPDPHAPSVLIVRDRDALLGGYRRMQPVGPPQVVVQEYIPGSSDSVWMFNGYFDRNGERLCAFTGQKLRQRGPRTGPTTLGICIWNEAVAELATRLMGGLGYHGIVDMGVRYDERDGEYKVLDVNPRMGSSFRLFVGEDGLDVVRAAYLDLTSQPVPATRARDGRKWVVEPYDLVAAAQGIRAGALTPSQWVRSLSGVDEAAWWARDDARPFYAMCASLGWQGIRYRARRRRRRDAEERADSGRPIHADSPGQGVVDRYFDRSADYWHDVYTQDGLQGLIYRERMQATLRWADDLDLPPGARVLDVGCGAGLLTAELSRRGYQVTATDSSSEMVTKAQQHMREVGIGDAVRVEVADVHDLPYTSGQFDLIVAVGLLPWLHDWERAIGEMSRVLRPAGWLAVTADNRARLNFTIEPRENPLLAPIRYARRAARRAAGHRRDEPDTRLHLPGQVERTLRSAGMRPVRRTTVGFGPFTFLSRPVLNDAAGFRVHRRLQAASERRAPGLRRLGWHYLVAAQKPDHANAGGPLPKPST